MIDWAEERQHFINKQNGEIINNNKLDDNYTEKVLNLFDIEVEENDS